MKKYFVNCKTLEELKKEYKKLAMMYHPDRPTGDLKIMQEVNAEYEIMFNILKEQGEAESGKVNYESVNEFRDIIDNLMKYNDVTIQQVGTWLWVSGEGTKIIKEELKSMKFWWNKDRKVWQRKPENELYKKHRNSKESDETIKNRYGCQIIKTGINKNAYCLA